MALFDKLNQVAKSIGDRTNDAIEATRLHSRIGAERSAAAEDLQKIGAHYYAQFAAGGEAAPEVLALCQSARAHYDAAAEAQAELERLRAEGEGARPPAAPAGRACPGCGAAVAPGVKFCSACGRRMED